MLIKYYSKFSFWFKQITVSVVSNLYLPVEVKLVLTEPDTED